MRTGIAGRIVIVFVIAGVLNLIWEELHSLLYVHYRGQDITHVILARAALFDAFVTSIFAYPFLRFSSLKDRLWVMVSGAVVFAIGLEMWALSLGRWQYRDIMPLVPILGVGLTPTVQLGFLAYLSVKIQYLLCRDKA